VQKTIRAAQFMYFIPTGQVRLNRKTGQEEEVLSVRHAFSGDTVDIPRDEDIESGEAAGAFEQDEVEQESPVAEEAAAPDGPDFSSHDSLVYWIKQERPTAAQVVDAADEDPDKAEALLAAEQEATGGQPRKAVIRGLNEIALNEDDEEE
jgi:hypothetical protein